MLAKTSVKCEHMGEKLANIEINPLVYLATNGLHPTLFMKK